MGFKLTAIVTLAAFYGCYLGKMFSQKRRGIQTSQIGKGKTGFVKFIELAMLLASVLVLAAELASIFTGASRAPAAIRLIGAVIGALGTAAFIAAVYTMRDSWRAGVSESDKTELVTGGVYQISRNPAFLGFDLLYLGILLMFFNWVLCIITVFAVVMFHLQIVNVEEDHLIAAFGDEYLQYMKKVRRYIGRKI